ncbi:MAG TPA: molybdenum cofactor guanylyltransferase [Terriglobales bacterium]|nr:molybdenum cofactor guanylyltransferase [Terriglobales bacterium]
MPRTELTRMGFVIAGGKSSRMGADKAFLDFGGQTLLDRALAVMGAVCERVAIVGDPARFAKYESPKCKSVVADIFSGCGPLAGIHAALVHSPAELNLMLAVDMPFVSKELLEFLFAAAADEDNHAIITVPRTSKGLQPLCAVYRRDFSTTAEEALRAGKYKVDATFSSVAVRVIEEAELAAAGFTEQSFFNMNTPQDRLAAEGRSC